MNILDLGLNVAGATTDIHADHNFSNPLNRADVWIEQMVEASQRAPRVDIVELTPPLAKALLARNTVNRKLKDGTASRYMRDILNDRFTFNGASVVVSRTGRLLDGQHRCKAVADGNQPITVVMVFGVDDPARKTMDQGRNRTAADYLTMDGHKDGIALAAAASLYWQYLTNGGPAVAGPQRPTKGEIMSTIEDHPGLEKSLDTIPRKNCDLVGGRSLLAFCHYAITVHTSDRAAATAFIISLVDGEGLSADSPILYARNRLFSERGKRRAAEKAYIIFRAWNAHRRGETPKTLQYKVGAPLPVLEK